MLLAAAFGIIKWNTTKLWKSSLIKLKTRCILFYLMISKKISHVTWMNIYQHKFFSTNYIGYLKKQRVCQSLLTMPFFFPVFTYNSHVEVMSLVQQAKENIKRGKYDEAEMLYLRALHLALQTKQRELIALVQDLLANVHLQQNHIEQAEVLFRNVLTNIIVSGTSPTDITVIEVSLKLASIYAQQNKEELAISGYSWCKKVCKKTITEIEGNVDKDKNQLKNWYALLGMVLDSYGRYLNAIGKYELAIQYTVEASDISVKLYGEVDARTLVLYNDIASIKCELNQYDQAMKYMEKVVVACETFPNLVSVSELSVFYTNLAHICKLQGKQAEAENAYKQALIAVSKTNNDELKEQVASFAAKISK